MRLLNVFQPGLVRGSAKLPHDPEKAYAYVEHPTEGWRVYLRTATFLHPSNEPFQARHFIVVKRTGTDKRSASWEPPKGQMEGKDLLRKPDTPLLDLLSLSARREIEEESFVTRVDKMTHTSQVFQSRETTYPPNHFFQYHIFQGYVRPDILEAAFDMFVWIHQHPKAFARFSRDRREKDEIAWFDPRRTRLNPRWCPTIVFEYLKEHEETK